MERYVSPGGVVIPAAAVRFSFARSGGPGGQHVNTSATKVRVVIDLDACGLPADQLERLRADLGPTVEATADEHRSQWRNRQAALDRALRRIDRVLAPRAHRRPTRPSAASRQRRLEAKARQAQRKADRRRPTWD